MCISPLQSAKKLPVKCTTNNDCVSKYNKYIGGVTTGTCKCGYNPGGISYCMPFDGDFYGSRLLGLVEEWEGSSGISKCNVDVVYEYSCMASHWSKEKAAEFAYYIYMMNNYQAVLDVEDCVEQVYLQNFITIYNRYHQATSFASVIAGSFVGFLLIN